MKNSDYEIARDLKQFLDYNREFLDSNHIAYLEWEIANPVRDEYDGMPSIMLFRDEDDGANWCHDTTYGYNFYVNRATKVVNVVSNEYGDYQAPWDRFIKSADFKHVILAEK